jgi:preprotein translocase subunit YajC
MKLEQATEQRIIRNAFLSLFIYLLPLALMFATFYFTGQRPWEKKKQTKKNVRSSTTKKTLNNDIND